FVLERSRGRGAAPSSLAALFLLEDHEFVRAAYRVVLGREADEDGAHHYAEWLRAGKPRIDVLRVLRASAEARERGNAGDAALLASIDRAIARDAWARLPLLGPVIAQLAGLESHSPAAKEARRAGSRAAREAADPSSASAAFGDDPMREEGAPRSAADISARLITLPPAFAGAPHSPTA
ncbi:MAG TPA: DUF4214 domain-containing protein, partial [Usitatibacter sp.]|nr:DUF4214 domain-containing protein [Usitatibacter sp.]